MTASGDSTLSSTLSAAKLALAIKRLRAEHPQADLVFSDPIAIIGMGCRFPGDVRSPQDYWRLLRDGVDAITKAPPERWDAEAYFDPDPQAPGKTNSRWGGFLSGQDLFDPLLFGISPREAASIDPQQRLLLEVAWETLWDSGRAPESLAGSRTGVFVAISNSDYERLLFEDIETIGPHACSGGYRSVASGRISFSLDLHGPSISMDTACSSSLSVVHGACQSLRLGECDFALTGGVTLHLLPGHYVGLAKLGMLSPGGRCRTFDASADGFVPSEGCGMVALKRLADALADGDRIYAVIRGSALNQDGRTNVLTAPNGLAQQSVIRAALHNAQVNPADVSFVETHGTGTALGDPIEVEALHEALGAASPDAQPCALGAVKSNLGHMEAAAGIAGLMKASLALHHQEIPKNLHFAALNPHISLEGTRFYLPGATTAWPRGHAPRFAGVSSFGFSGTNAHVVLEEAPRVPIQVDQSPGISRPYLLPVSAQTPDALRSFARAYRSFATEAGGEIPLYDMCHTAACRRSHYEERIALTAGSHQELCGLLDDFLEGRARSGIARGRAAQRGEGVVFVCSGQGSQWAGMGMSLLRAEPVFRAAIEECERLIQGRAGWSLVEQLAAVETSKLSDTEFAQPAIFAIEVALARLWQSWGVVPAGIIGHSAGEVAAAHIAGVLSLEEAVRIVALRGRLMQGATGQGKMAAVHLPASRVAKDLAPYGARVSIAAINSPESTVIAGDPDSVDELVRGWLGRGIGCRLLPVNYAFHSSQMRPYSEELARALGSVETRAAKIPVVSTVFGRITRAEEFDAAYWGRNILRTVLFSDAVLAATDLQLRTFVEIGPHPVLLHSVGECLGADNHGPENLIASMRRNQDELPVLLSALGTLYTTGCPVEWKSVYRKPAPAVPLPTYPYQRQRFWLEKGLTTGPATKKDVLHPLLGTRLRSPSIRGAVFESQLDLRSLPYLADHRIEGRMLAPMTVLLEMGQRAAREASGGSPVLADVTVLDSLELRDDTVCTVQVVVENDDLRIFSLQGEAWKLHVTARVTEAGSQHASIPLPVGSFIGPDRHYARLASFGIEFGSAFRTVENLRTGDGEAWVRVRLQAAEQRESGRYLFHPSLLDGCLQAAVAAAPDTLEGLYLPFGLDRFEIWEPAKDTVWAHASLRPSGNPDLLSADIVIGNESGAVLARLSGLRLKRRSAGRSKSYVVDWRTAVRDRPVPALPGTWRIVSDDPAAAAALVKALEARGQTVFLAGPAQPLENNGDLRAVVRMVAPDVVETLTLAQEMLAGSKPPQLWLVTQGAVAVNAAGHVDRCDGIWQSPVWGLARTVAMEHPELRCARVDLDPLRPDYAALADELTSWDGEAEIAFRGGIRHVPRLARKTVDLPQPTRWAVTARGSIENLVTEPVERRAPAAEEVEVEVSALNFRDVLNVLGMYPGDPGQPGLEFCGKVVRAGAASALEPGDRVMGLAWGALASFVTTPAALVVPVPDGWAPAEACAAPNAYLTAWHCLVRLGHLQRGERVLIHAATGGVGLAAVQVARQAGAEIFATAGSEEKRSYLRSLGISHVFSSRTPDFAGEIAALTGGTGVDLVLNSLAGEFIDAGFAALAEGGGFIEIGKNGIWTAEQAAAIGKRVRYFVVDLATVIESDPAQIQAGLCAIRQSLEDGSFSALPTRIFEFEDAPVAFRYMAQAKHIGKIVLRHPMGFRVVPESTYLITGGMGAVGLRMSQWLVERGARNLVLVGRGGPAHAVETAIEVLRNAGARVEIRVADVSERPEIEAVFRDIKTTMPPLAGVIHAAGVLDDGVVTQQSAARIARVLAPKVTGAWNLHELTAAMPLDFFILCSSVASLTGSPGQVGYAAGNAFLDTLAHYRRARGLRALSVNWGAWAQTGMAARVAGQGRRSALPGVRPMPAEECLEYLEQAAGGGHAQVAIAVVDWSQFRPAPRLIAGLTGYTPDPKATAPADDILRQLEAAPAGNRRKLLVDYLRKLALQILGLSPSLFLDEHRPLTSMGLDSLMAVEFRNQLAAALNRTPNATLLFDRPTLASLADFIDDPEGRATPVPLYQRDPDLQALELLSEDEAEELLKKELERS